MRRASPMLERRSSVGALVDDSIIMSASIIRALGPPSKSGLGEFQQDFRLDTMKPSLRTIAITGATGFVGGHVVKRLLDEPDLALRCLVRSETATKQLAALDARVTCVRGDVCEPSSLTPLMEGAWGIVHLAGYRDFWSLRPELYDELNTRGAENVFRAALAANVHKVVQVSTPLAFGVPETIPFDEETAPGPHPSQYARSKYLADQIGWRMHADEGLPLTVVHLAAVIGAGDPRPTMEVRRAVERRLPVLVGAETTYTYVHVADAAEAIVRALLESREHRPALLDWHRARNDARILLDHRRARRCAGAPVQSPRTRAHPARATAGAMGPLDQEASGNPRGHPQNDGRRLAGLRWNARRA